MDWMVEIIIYYDKAFFIFLSTYKLNRRFSKLMAQAFNFLLGALLKTILSIII